MRYIKQNILLILLAGIMTFVMSGCGSSADTTNSLDPNDPIVPPPVGKLEKIGLTFNNGSTAVEVPVKVTGNLVATGWYSDGSQKDLTSKVTYHVDDETVVEVKADGYATALSPGDATIYATLDNIQSNDVNVKVTTATLVSIFVEPMNIELPIGVPHQYIAEGQYSDGDTEDITDIVKWESNNTKVASIDKLGMVSAESVGEAKISASLDGIVGDTMLYVTNPKLVKWYIEGASEVTKGFSTQLLAKAEFDNGKTYTVNPWVVWSSDKIGNATVDSKGKVTGIEIGLAKITAARKNTSETQTHSMKVVAESFEYIQIELGYNESDPNPITDLDVPLGGNVYITAWGYRTNGERVYINTDVLWRSDNPSIAEINSRESSYVYGIAPGETVITATLRGVSDSIKVKVVPGYIFKDNVRWEKSVDVTDMTAKGETGKPHDGLQNPNSTAVWYYVQKGQGYTEKQTVGQTNFSFAATLAGSTNDVYVNVYLYDENGTKKTETIFNDSDWTALQNDPVKKDWTIRTNYFEWSEGKNMQSNFILRLGSSTYTGDDSFTIDHFSVSPAGK